MSGDRRVDHDSQVDGKQIVVSMYRQHGRAVCPKVPHIVAGLAIYARSTLAQTGVSGPVVVDGESFLDALFASAGQG